MVGIWWRSETFTHAFLVPPIVVWMIWREREALKTVSIRPKLLMLLPLGMLGFLWLVGDLVSVNAATQFAVVGMVVLLVPLVFGYQATRFLLFPLAFLFFCVPVGEFAMPKLMEWTADFTVKALRLSGIPVYREGLQFVIPSGNWSVVEACSGVRYLIASLTVGTLFAYLNYKSTSRRLAFVVVSALVPILANWLRAYLIVMLGHLSGNKLAAGVDHLIYGWVFFGVVILLMFMIGAKWADMPADGLTRWASEFGSASSVARGAVGSGLLVLTACLGLLTVGIPKATQSTIHDLKSSAPVVLEAPATLSTNWRLSQSALVDWTPAFENPSAKLNATYENNSGDKVGVFIGYYRDQGYDRKLVSSQNVLVRSRDSMWAQVGGGVDNLTILGHTNQVRTARLKSAGAMGASDSLVLSVRQTYWVNGKLMSNDVRAKLEGAVMQLLGKGDDSAVIILYRKEADGSADNAAFELFSQANGARILSLLEGTAAHGRSSAIPVRD